MIDSHPLILQLDVAGNPQRWVSYEEAACYYAKDMVAWTVGGGEFAIHGGKSRLSGETSIMDLETIIAVKGDGGEKSVKYVHRIPTLSNRALFRRDHHMCAYCGNVFGAGHLTREHIHPRSKGGQDKWMNVVTACGPCNKHKNDRTPEQANMKLLYVPYIPTQSEYLILMNRTILANQMEFLLARVPPTSRLVDEKFKQLLTQ